MKKTKKVGAALCGAFCLVAGHAIAGTYEVPGQYATIQAAIDVALGSSVINVAPGVYKEHLIFKSNGPITVKGTGGVAATIIDGEGSAPIITLVGQNTSTESTVIQAVLSGFTLQNGYSATTGGVATVGLNQGLAITDCIIKNNQAGSGGAFAVSGAGGTLTLRNSLIANNTAVNAGGAVYAALGIVYLVNDTITANIAADGASINQQYGASVQGLNNIIYGNSLAVGTAGYPVFNDPTTAPICYSIIEGGFAAPTCTNNIDVNPGFVDAAAGNYQLTASSPAIDIAMVNYATYSATPTIDVLGVARPQGRAADYGAYEFVYPPVNGTCGTADGGTFITAPTTGLCSAGTQSAVSGFGPYLWNCVGSGTGVTVACSAQHQVSADVTPPTATSIVTIGNTEIRVTFSEAVTRTTTLNTVKVGTYSAAVTAAGSLVYIRLPSEGPVMVPGVVYTLTIPAGIFVDAAGNPNALISVPVMVPVIVPVNGICGSASGAIFTAAPTANLCSAGTESAVTGVGPFNWTCAGNNGGMTASCSAQLQVADTTRPSVVSTVVTKGANVGADVITVTFTEPVTKTKFLDSIMKIGRAGTFSTVSGFIVTIEVNSSSLYKVKAGKTYDLTIPAGSFKDAAGNRNKNISIHVTL